MTNTRALFLTGLFALLATACFITVETPFAEKYNLSNGLLLTFMGIFSVIGIAIIIRQFNKN